MKNIIKNALLVIVIIACVCAIHAMDKADEITETEYQTTTVVVGISECDDFVLCMDKQGNEFGFFGVENWEIGDFALLTMSDNGTENIEDDEIVNARYTGYLNGVWGNGLFEMRG